VHLSLIIPTHNRADSLERTLRSAIALASVTGESEVIVVDNASADRTPRLLREVCATAPDFVRSLREDRLGLHHARHSGAQAARGDVLVFTDDDVTFHRSFLRNYAKAFSGHPEMAAAGGPVRPIWEAPPPSWLLQYIGHARAFAPLSIMEPFSEFHLGPDGWFYGVNMAIRREHLFEVGGFNPEAVGDNWVGDGETGLNRKLWDRGLLVGYVPDALVYHHIPAERLTVDYLRSRATNDGICSAYTRFHEHVPSAPSLWRDAAAMALRVSVTRFAAALVARISGRTSSRSLALQFRAARWRGELSLVRKLIRDEEFRTFVLRKDWLGSPMV
jgi:glucosyl-dolichyl phosphate glucuronosyltransferase